MRQALHGCATTTQVTRRQIQKSTESVRMLAQDFGVNTNKVQKWRNRDFVEDLPTGPGNPRLRVLLPVEEAVCVGFRHHTLLPLDDCLYTLQTVIPHLSRLTLRRCFQRHNISRLPKEETGKVRRGKFEECGIGFLHIDIAEVYTEEGRLRLFVAIERASNFAYAEMHERKTVAIAAEFLRGLVARVPFKIHTILTDNGLQFNSRGRISKTFAAVCDCVRAFTVQAGSPWTHRTKRMVSPFYRTIYIEIFSGEELLA